MTIQAGAAGSGGVPGPGAGGEPGITLTASVTAIEQQVGSLASATVTRLHETLSWFRELPADQRAMVMVMVQTGMRSMVDWLRQRGVSVAASPREASDRVFEAVPRALTRSVSLLQTVQVITAAIDVVEEQVSHLAVEGERAAVREAALQFSREVAVAAARLYAGFAERRGTWDARLQALLVDAFLRGDSADVLTGSAAALGWTDATPVSVAVGRPPGGEPAPRALYRKARELGVELLAGVHGDRVVLVLGGAPDPIEATRALLDGFGDGPVVVGPAVPSLDAAVASARAALAGFRVAPAWRAAPRPVAAAELLPERVLAGDVDAHRILREEVYARLAGAGGELLETLDAFLAAGNVVESAARSLFVHPNTVRYRLRRITDVTGLSPLASRDAYALRVALTVGLLDLAPR